MIVDSADLDRLIDLIKGAPWVALDTEADSLHSYPERLCLFQLSVPGLDEVADPLGSLDLRPLLALLERKKLVLHGADFDLRLLYRTYGFVPVQVFDTMVAARLLGEPRFSLNDLLTSRMGVSLSKSLRKANWSLRPLAPELIRYASDDTRYLHPLAEMLSRELEEKGRTTWLEESCARLVAQCTQPTEVDRETLWRIRGADQLERPALAVLRELYYWREDEAIAANRPPYFVLSHEALIALARESVGRAPDGLELPGKLSSRRCAGLRAAIRRGLELPESDWPERASSMRRRQVQPRADVKPLMRRRDQRASELGIDPTLIANRATLERLAADWEAASTELMSWQRELLSGPERSRAAGSSRERRRRT